MTYFHHLGLIADEFPITASSRSPRPLVLDLLTTWGADAWMPSASLVALLGDFGVATASARTTLSRLSRRGLVEVRRDGRTSAYRLDPATAREMIRMNTDVLEFGAAEREWDGQWAMVVFSLDSHTRQHAHTVRGQLRWLGFGPLRDGVWIAPHADLERTREFLDQWLDRQGVLVRGPVLVGEVDLATAWPIDDIAQEYDQFVERCQQVRYRLAEGRLTDADALIERIDLLADWRRFPTIDPDLPSTMLPSTWPRRHAREVLVDILDPLDALARRRMTRRLDDAPATALASVTTVPSVAMEGNGRGNDDR